MYSLKLISPLFIITLLVVISCDKKIKEQQCVDASKIEEKSCTTEYMPVCGCDGKTYGNDCEASNAGLLSWTEGECT